jgi:hypothetical protein
MVKMEIGEEDLVSISPSHLGGKQNVYIKSEKSDTTKFYKPNVGNKETIINNCY